MTRPRWLRPCGDWRPAAFTQGDVLTLVVVVLADEDCPPVPRRLLPRPPRDVGKRTVTA